MSAWFRVLENQDRELGIWDVGSLFGEEGVSIDRKICCLIFRGKMMPLIFMRALHETCSTSPDLNKKFLMFWVQHITVTFECTDCFEQV